jgi:hypothetical protein
LNEFGMGVSVPFAATVRPVIPLPARVAMTGDRDAQFLVVSG